MADNTELNAGTGGDTIASDDIGGIKHQRVKLSIGADGTAVDAVPVVNGLDTTATGVQAVGVVGQFDDAATGTVTENQFAPVRISSRRALLVEGVASGTVIPVSDGAGSLTVDGTVAVTNSDLATLATTVKAEDVASAEADPGIVVMARRTDTPAAQSGTDGDYEFLQVTGGRLAVQATGSGTFTVDGSGVTQPVSHAALTELAAAIDTELQVDVVGALPAGTNAIGKLAANSGVDIGDVDVTSVIAGTGATNLGKAEDAQHTSGDVGVMALGVRSAAPSERSAGPTDADYEPFATNEVGAVWGTLTPSANGGCTTFMASGSDGSSILVATAQVVKASAGVLYGYYAYNPESAVTFVHFYNTAAASVTVGTTNPLFTIQIPATSAANLALPYGITFSNAGWSVAATTTAGGNTAPATGVSLVAWYK